MAGAAVTPLAPLAALCALRRAVRLSAQGVALGAACSSHELMARAPGGLRGRPCLVELGRTPSGGKYGGSGCNASGDPHGDLRAAAGCGTL